MNFNIYVIFTLYAIAETLTANLQNQCQFLHSTSPKEDVTGGPDDNTIR